MSYAFPTLEKVYRLAINVAATATTTIATGVAGKQQVLMSMFAGTATTIGKFSILSGSTALTASMNQSITSPTIMPYIPQGWCAATSGAALKIKTTGANGIIRGHCLIGEISA